MALAFFHPLDELNRQLHRITHFIAVSIRQNRQNRQKADEELETDEKLERDEPSKARALVGIATLLATFLAFVYGYLIFFQQLFTQFLWEARRLFRL